MEVFCKKAILKTKMGSFFKKATVLRNICEPLLLYVVQADISLSLSLSRSLSLSLSLSLFLINWLVSTRWEHCSFMS